MIDPQLVQLLQCPVSGDPLFLDRDRLATKTGTSYPVIDGVPVLLPEEFGDSGSGAASHTHRVLRNEIEPLRWAPEDIGRLEIHPVVQQSIAAAGGNLYVPSIGRLDRYPIPAFPADSGSGRVMLDVGCHWGRWTIAAARRGYLAIGVEPSLDAALAAQVISKQVGTETMFVVGDARHLPFHDSCIDLVFSFSVLQHFSGEDRNSAIDEIGRVLSPGGRTLVQMANARSLLGWYHRARRRFRQGKGFEVRYWSGANLRRAFEARVGPAEIKADAFFSLNAQLADLRFLSLFGKAVVVSSAMLVQLSRWLPGLKYLADSLMVDARKPV